MTRYVTKAVSIEGEGRQVRNLMQGDDGPLTLGATLPLLRSQMANLPIALKRIGKYVLENPDLVIHHSVSELGLLTKSGPASVVRFCRALGFVGLREFKLALAGDLAMHRAASGVSRPQARGRGFDGLFDSVVEATRVTQSLIDAEAIDRVAAVLAAARRIDVYGGGTSGLVAQYMAFRLLRIGLPAYAIVDPTLGVQLASGLGRGCAALAFSESGMTPDVVEALQRAKAEGAATALVTHRRDGPAVKFADEVLLTAGTESPMTASKTLLAFTHLVVIEVLATILGQRLDSRSRPRSRA